MCPALHYGQREHGREQKVKGGRSTHCDPWVIPLPRSHILALSLDLINYTCRLGSWDPGRQPGWECICSDMAWSVLTSLFPVKKSPQQTTLFKCHFQAAISDHLAKQEPLFSVAPLILPHSASKPTQTEYGGEQAWPHVPVDF